LLIGFGRPFQAAAFYTRRGFSADLPLEEG
jgi:hypothetical protein